MKVQEQYLPTLVKPLQEDHEFDQAIIAKLQFDAAQVVCKDRIIEALHSDVQTYIDEITVLRANEIVLVNRISELENRVGAKS